MTPKNILVTERRRHTTHHDDCGCLTVKYKMAMNALLAIQRHQEIVCGGCNGLNTTCHIVNKAIDDIRKKDEI